jgi:GNAT superfamily N-acetyltransferase
LTAANDCIALVDLTQQNTDLHGLTYPRCRHLLSPIAHDSDQAWPQAKRLAVVARAAQGPIGLALVCWTDNAARLVSLFVVKSARRRGIATALLDRVMAELTAAGIAEIDAHYASRQDRHAFVSLLAARGWSGPKLLEFRLAGYADWPDRMGPDWARFMDRLQAAGFGWTPLGDLSDHEKDVVTALEAEANEVPVPFWKCFDHADPAISILLRQHDAVVGYIIGETDNATGQHHYTAGYVTKRLQRMGWLPAGLDVVCRLQAAAYGAQSVALYETPGNNARMIDFMKRRLTPVTIWTEERFTFSKQIAREDAV